MNSRVWWYDGLRFECTGCGDCCAGDPGYVWVTGAEIVEMASALGCPTEEFERLYVRPVGVRKSLLERPNGDCVFLDATTRLCGVYAARPVQCRTWPFWKSNLASPERWQETCEACPGSGRGRLFARDEIQQRITQKRV